MAITGQLEKSLGITGGTDGTDIGNVGDRLKVETTGTVSIAGSNKTSFTAVAIDVVIGNGKSMISITNTSVTKILRVFDIHLINTQTTAVTGVIADFRLLRCATHSAGTLVTPAVHDTTMPLDAGISVRTGATIGTESATPFGRWKYSTDEWGVGTADVESFDHAIGVLFPLYSVNEATTAITLRTGEGLTLKQLTNSAAGSFDIQLIFTQEDI